MAEIRRPNVNPEDYTFWGLFTNGQEMLENPMNTLAYNVGLADGPTNPVTDLKKAKFVLRYCYDVEEQVQSSRELLMIQKNNLPQGYWVQSPVMLTLRWSPISTILQHGWEPIVLNRESHGMACASGIWEPRIVRSAPALDECETPEELFWYVLDKVVEKAMSRSLLVSLVASPGWSYEFGALQNLTLEEALAADRVIWQRRPRQNMRRVNP